MTSQVHRERRPSTTPRWGLRLPAEGPAARIERAWRVPLLVALVGTIPAFYDELLEASPSIAAPLAYLLAALVTLAARLHTARRSPRPLAHLLGNPIDGLLVVGLLTAALLPSSQASGAALGWRLAVAMLVLLRILWALQRLISRGSLAYLLMLAVAVLGLCGAGFWWLEPTVHSLGDGLWLAFTTAATVGYGDLVPTTSASRIFAVFVVLLGFGVLSMVTAAVAAAWVETEERRIEREILHDLRSQIGNLRVEITALRAEVRSAAHLQAGQRGTRPASKSG